MNCLLVRHKTRAHTQIKPFKCPMCAKGFKTKRDLKIHMDSHDPSKNYICNQCGKYRRTWSNSIGEGVGGGMGTITAAILERRGKVL